MSGASESPRTSSSPRTTGSRPSSSILPHAPHVYSPPVGSVASGSPASLSDLDGVLAPDEPRGEFVTSALVQQYDFDPPREGSAGERAHRTDRGWCPAHAFLFTEVLIISTRLPDPTEAVHTILPLDRIRSVRRTKMVSDGSGIGTRRRYPLNIEMPEPGVVMLSFATALERLEFCMSLEYVLRLPFGALAFSFIDFFIFHISRVYDDGH